ncbi:MAG: CoA transferase [bacterium]|nr:CoA transferase [bacterium]
MGKPLDGITVVDLSRVLSGPYCTMLLADMGADVVKIERPGTGDDTRALGPPFIGGESAYFLSVNRNKRSVALNLKDDRCVRIVKQLIATADVVVENFRPGTMEALGLGYETIHALNPRIVFCSISGYGHTGPNAHLPGYDLVIQGEGGVASLTGDPSGPPYKVGVSQADIIAGMTAFQGILLALLARAQTGRGQHVDIGMLDCQVALLTYQAGIHFATGADPTRMGNLHPTIAPYTMYRCGDGHFITIACANDATWQCFCRTVERTTWVEDERFRTNADRVQHREQLDALIGELLSGRSSHAWITTLQAHGVPCGRIQSVGEVCDHPQVRAREMVVELLHPTVGPMYVTGIPIKLSDTPGAIHDPPPLLGQHTAQVLTEWLHLDATAVDALRKDGVVS